MSFYSLLWRIPSVHPIASEAIENLRQAANQLSGIDRDELLTQIILAGLPAEEAAKAFYISEGLSERRTKLLGAIATRLGIWKETDFLFNLRKMYEHKAGYTKEIEEIDRAIQEARFSSTNGATPKSN